MNDFDYTKNDIIECLKNVGIKSNDILFIHSNLGFFGILKDAKNKNDYCNAFKEAIFEIIGNNGTLVVPTFSNSFFNNQVYDKTVTKTNCGIFSEFILEHNESIRSDDPNFSVAAIGKQSTHLTENVSNYSFGKNSFWDRFLKINGKLCRFNLNPNFMTFIHYVEKSLDVSYRYDKSFNGTCFINREYKTQTFYHFVRDLSKSEHETDLSLLETLAITEKIMKMSNLGRGKITCSSSVDIFNLVSRQIQKEPFFLIKGKTT